MPLGSVRSCCPAPCLSFFVCFNHTVAPDSDSIRDVSQKMNGSEAPWGRSHFPRERSEAAHAFEVYSQPGDSDLQEVFLLSIGWGTVSPSEGYRFTVDNLGVGVPFHRG